jgi:hypothetical protein
MVGEVGGVAKYEEKMAKLASLPYLHLHSLFSYYALLPFASCTAGTSELQYGLNLVALVALTCESTSSRSARGSTPTWG